MKKNLFSLLTITSALCGMTLHADDCNDYCVDYCSESAYVGVFGGVDFLQNINGRHDLQVKSKTGCVAGAAVGYNFDEILRIEAEFAYRNHSIRSYKFAGENIKGHFKNETFSGMVNVYHDFDLGCDIVHYVGAGIGFAQNKVSFSPKRNVDVSIKADGFACQGIAGFSYKLPEYISSKTLASLEYRFFATRNHVKDHAVIASAKRYF
jgi:opacity protein-like surface antigen